MRNILLSYQRTTLFVLCLLFPMFVSCQTKNTSLVIKRLGDNYSLVRLNEQKKFLLLPVEDAAPIANISIMERNEWKQSINIRLAVHKVDYLVPVDLSSFSYDAISLLIKSLPYDAIAWKEMKLDNEFDASNREQLRPAYHFSPAYGWMNDPNGMVYKDGVYHLFYQYNPYGSTWENMHWGHATSTDLTHWEHLPVALAPDAMGAIFSGSCVVDKDNTAGFGAGAIVAFYTSSGERQTQSMAYSLDNGKTFVKYDKNPILTSPHRDFRDPKVFWHAETKKWIMILAVGQEMQLYSSVNLKDWDYESNFGNGQGAHGGVWECPDLVRLPVEGSKEQKWVLVCNLNPGGLFGGSATQYFVGNFDGKKFVNDSPSKTKWLDWGKDHYAMVTWSNAPDNRTIALAWMSNWQYANEVPTTQYRSANSVPRELELYKEGKEYMIKVSPVKELKTLRTSESSTYTFDVKDQYAINRLFTEKEWAYEIRVRIKNHNAEVIGFQLFNDKGEVVNLYYNMVQKLFFMDRSKSGNISFHKDFAATTSAPFDGKGDIELVVYVDHAGFELFDGKGHFSMTNLVFPSEPYNRMSFYAKGGSYSVKELNIYQLKK